MKTLIFVLFAGLVLSGVVSAQEQKTTAAVMDLEAKEGVSQGVAGILSDSLRTYLVNTNKFTMVTRENMEHVLKEQAFQLSGCTSQECIVQAGQLLGVRKMFAGSIGKVGATYVINLKIIDIESGKIERAVTEQCAKCEEDALLISTTNIANKIINLPISIVEKPLVSENKKIEWKSWLGLKVQTVSERNIKSFKLSVKQGVLVRGFVPNSPGEGVLQEGDVIIQVDDKSIKNLAGFKEVITKSPPGKKVIIKTIREGKEVLVELTIGQKI